VFRHWLSRKKLIRVSGLIRKRRNDHRHLLQIRFLNAFVRVHVGVVRPRFVLDRVLYELKSGQADLVERATLALTYREFDCSRGVTGPCGPISCMVGFTSTIGSRRRAAANRRVSKKDFGDLEALRHPPG